VEFRLKVPFKNVYFKIEKCKRITLKWILKEQTLRMGGMGTDPGFVCNGKF
jgi:hypothetical protein